MKPIKVQNENSRILAIFLACLVSSVAILFDLMLQNNCACAQERQFKRRRTIPERTNLQNDRSRDFYRVIAENNLFRPLGWKAPKQQPEYVLIATWVEPHGKAAKALLAERSSKRTYYVGLGQNIGIATIEKIKPKQVVLKISGEDLTLKIPSIQFLNHLSWLSNKKPNQTADSTAKDNASIRSRQMGANRVRPDVDGAHPSGSQRLPGKFRNSSLEDRRKNIEAIRQQLK